MQTDTDIKSETYRFYLHCFCDLLFYGGRDANRLAGEIIAKTGNLQGLADPDVAWISRWMKIAWNTESLVSLGADDPQLVRINNQWKPIQAYYAVYAAAEAASYVLDGVLFSPQSLGRVALNLFPSRILA